MRGLILLWCTAVTLAALWTGAWTDGRFFTTMTGFLPPHYGYSAYAASALLFLTPWRAHRGVAALAVLLSGNRAAWLGAIAGWAVTGRGSRRRALLAASLALLGVVGGLAFKPRKAGNDVIRVRIWATAWKMVERSPWTGNGGGGFAVALGGRAFHKAHSDVLQLAVERGLPAAAGAVLLVLGGLWRLPQGPVRSALACLSVQSVVDNRLHHPACAGLYAALWLLAVFGRPRNAPTA